MSSNGDTSTSQLLNVTMVAVDKGKSSGHAFRWTIKNIDNPVIIALHIKHKNITNQSTDVVPPDEEDVANVFNNFRQMCQGNNVQLKEAVIHDGDIVRGIVEYAQRNRVNTIVVGAGSSNKSSFARSLYLRSGSKKLKGPVSTGVMKSAPDHSSVFVISKGKIVGARPAIRPMVNMVQAPSEHAIRSQNAIRSENAISENRTHAIKSGSINGRSERSLLLEMPRSSSVGQSMEHRLIFCRSSDGSDSSTSNKIVSSEGNKQESDLSDSQFTEEMENEMKRLKLKLKQTMDMYGSACKEAMSAESKAKEINQRKLDEERMAEVAKLSKEAALALAEKEKFKAKAALEAAEEAIKMVEKEAQRRFHAEMKARREAHEKDRALNQLACKDIRCRKYSITDVEDATQKFSPALKVGEGGYGPVFKGQLDHTPVAIKILNPEATHGRRQFQQEVEVLCSIRHPNMVLLIGACPEYGCLVYEYLENGSLEDRLLRKNDSPPIPWWKRFEIAAEIATALLFLHQTKPEPIVHRDLKPANILLDRNFVSKISDVGLARLVPASVADSVTQYHLTAAAGTFCYIDPEYQQTGMLTTKSDVYSLGIMLLQIITAKAPMGLAHHVLMAIEDGTFSEMLDPSISDWPLEKTLEFAKLSLGCAELSKKDRPDLATVVVPKLNQLRDFGLASHNKLNPSLPQRPLSPTRTHRSDP
ncbi:U-box domain-containing protein 34-like [Vigna unguiculata]|uniref:RING-type E3 ubiquitin transferase n=1 Tax=Vigna unguiculata TaxID=3917 RepID=A0A4D6MD34_VIGUN|nr:U-box domain-containing protein 34-like [Vigna unguiculata]QCD99275.1 interleukin-1 receptor-associated kinase 4 [Vigna unguiculata]